MTTFRGDRSRAWGVGARRLAPIVRLRDVGRRGPKLYCPRCAQMRFVHSRRQTLWRWLRGVWFALAVLAIPCLIALTPLLLLLWPLLACFALALGPLLELASSPVRCATCELRLDETTPPPALPPAVPGVVVPLQRGWRRIRLR